MGIKKAIFHIKYINVPNNKLKPSTTDYYHFEIELKFKILTRKKLRVVSPTFIPNWLTIRPSENNFTKRQSTERSESKQDQFKHQATGELINLIISPKLKT